MDTLIAAQHIGQVIALTHHWGAALPVFALNSGDPGQLTAFFKTWADAAKQWMPFLLIFGVVIGYLLMTFGSRMGGEHMRNNILAAFAVLFVIAIAPGIFS